MIYDSCPAFAGAWSTICTGATIPFAMCFFMLPALFFFLPAVILRASARMHLTSNRLHICAGRGEW